MISTAIWILLGIAAAILLKKRRNNGLLLILSLSCTLAVIDIVLSAGEYLRPRNETHYEFSEKYVTKAPPLQWWHKPGMRSRVSKTRDDVVMFRNVLYTLDEKGRRKSLPDMDRARKHALFFGCSFTFGEGVPDDQNLPSYFQAVSGNEYKAYNYGSCGFGTSSMFLQLDRDDLFDDVAPASGIAVYSFISSHLERSTPYDILYLASAPHVPLFYSDDYGDRLRGPFRYSDMGNLGTIVDMFHRFWIRSPLFRFMAQRLSPKYISEEQATLIAAKMIIGSKDKYKRRFNGDFYVLFWPRHTDMDAENKKLLKDLLTKDGIKVIEVPAMADAGGATLHPSDTHPGSKEYRYVAEYLYRAIDDAGGLS